jgi:DNA-binding NarL/FixJ family response regulator
MNNRPHRIAVLEDSAPVREHFLHIIEEADDLVLSGVATRMSQAPMLLEGEPDLVLTDLGLPDGNGLDFIPVLKAAGVQSLVITAFVDRETVLSALAAGADGYLLKDSSTESVLEGIRSTLSGGAPISAAAAVFMLERFREATVLAEAPADTAAASTISAPAGERLTARETELLTLFARGHSYKAAARELGISPLTVGDHVKAIYRKLEVNSRGEAVFQAVQRGQLSL